MIPSSSPSATSSETWATILAPPMSCPRVRVARIGGCVTRLRGERMHRRLDVAGRDRLDHLRLVLAVLLLHELDLEHRLDHRVVALADPLDALRPGELPAFEGRDHLVDVSAAGLLNRMADHQRGDEAVRREEVRNLVLLAQLCDEPSVHLVLRRLV